MKITDHGFERMEQRLGLPKRAVERTAKIVWEQGFEHKDFKGRLKKYLDWVFLSHKKASALKIYSEHIWLFTNQQVLISVWRVPKQFLKAVNKKVKHAEEAHFEHKRGEKDESYLS